MQQTGYSGTTGAGAPAGTTTSAAGTTPSTAVGLNDFKVFRIRPWGLCQNYSLLYPEPTGLSVPVGAFIAFQWGNATHGVYKIPSAQCPTKFQNGLNGMEAIQEPVNGLSSAGQILVTYIVKKPGVYYFACPVDAHCQRGMKVKVTAK